MEDPDPRTTSGDQADSRDEREEKCLHRTGIIDGVRGADNQIPGFAFPFVALDPRSSVPYTPRMRFLSVRSLLPVLVVVGSILAGLVYVRGEGERIRGSLRPVPAGEECVLELDRGGYTLYWEVERSEYQEPLPFEVQGEIRDEQGKPLPVARGAAVPESHYRFGGKKGVSVLEFVIPAPGTYRLRVITEAVLPARGGFQLAPEFRSRTPRLQALGLGSVVVGVLLGGAIFVLLRRRGPEKGPNPPSGASN